MRAGKAWMPAFAVRPVFDASAMRSESPRLVESRPTSCPHVQNTREDRRGGVSEQSARNVRTLLRGSGISEMRARIAVQAGTTTRLTGDRSYCQRSKACIAFRISR